MSHGRPGKPIKNSAELTSVTAERTSTEIPTTLQGELLQRLLLETAHITQTRETAVQTVGVVLA